MTSDRRSVSTLDSRPPVLVVDLTNRDEIHSVEADALEGEIMDFLHELDLENCGMSHCGRCKPVQQKMMN